jgi:hypothetical protein
MSTLRFCPFLRLVVPAYTPMWKLTLILGGLTGRWALPMINSNFQSSIINDSIPASPWAESPPGNLAAG